MRTDVLGTYLLHAAYLLWFGASLRWLDFALQLLQRARAPRVPIADAIGPCASWRAVVLHRCHFGTRFAVLNFAQGARIYVFERVSVHVRVR